MFHSLTTRIKALESQFRLGWGKDISTPAARREAFWHNHLTDQAFLRLWWTNLTQVAPGVYRSNQPGANRIARYKEMGIKTILNLRGAEDYSYYLFEEEACAQHGISLVPMRFHARRAPDPDMILDLIETMRGLEKPFLLHCKSGADRAGLASAIYLLEFSGVSVESADRQLSLRRMHLDFTATGILDYMIRVFGARLDIGGIRFSKWIEREYDPQILTEAWNNRLSWIDAARKMQDAA